MKITLATLHVRRSAQSVPLAAGCLAAALPQELRDGCRLIELYPDQTAGQWCDAVLASRPDLVAFPLYSWNRTALLELSRALRRHSPDILLLAGGPEATGAPEKTLREGALDGVILGEGEQTFAHVATQLAAGEQPSPRPGLLWRDSVSEPDLLAPAPELATLPSPWLSGVLEPQPGGGVLWESSRGCLYACAYCFDARGSHGVRHVPRQRLEAELRLFAARHVAQAWVLDSTFNSPPQRGKELLRAMLRHAPEIHYHLEARAELLDPEYVELLAQLHCSVQLGLQTTTPQALKHLHRHFDPRDFEHACDLLNQAGVTFGIDLIYALPGDSHAGFTASLDYALRQRPNQLDIFPLAVLPGTELRRKQEDLGIVAAPDPPYLVASLPGYSADEIAQSRDLARACDLFYNRGRAVGFFAPLAETCELSGSELLEAFSAWLRAHVPLLDERLEHLEDWPLDELLEQQLAFARSVLEEHDKDHLVLAMRDLIRFHFYFAETLLGEETPPALEPPPENLATELFRLVPSLQLVDFHYEIADLLNMEASGLDLDAFADLFRPVGSTALFLRRGDEVACESLGTAFAQLLRECREPRTLATLSIADANAAELVELLTVAWEEGLLAQVTAGEADP